MKRLIVIAALILVVGTLPFATRDPEPAEANPIVAVAGHGLNLGFGTPAYEHAGTVTNGEFTASPYATTGPGNDNFEGGSLSPWTSPTSGFTQIGSGGNPGKYAGATASGPTLESGSWTVADDSQTISWDDIRTSAGGTYAVRIWDGSTEITLAALVTATTSWTTRTYNLDSFRGQTVTIRFKSVANGVGFDNVKVNTVVPNWNHVNTGTNILTLDGQGNPLIKGGSFVSSAFTIPADAQALVYKAKRGTGSNSAYNVQLLTGGGFGTAVTVKASLTAQEDDFKEHTWSIEAWAGQTVKLRFSSISNTLSLDSIQIWTAVPGWDIGSLETVPQERTRGPGGGYVHAINAMNLTSQPTEFSLGVTFWRSLRFPASGGSSCVQVFAYNASDDSLIGDYDTAVSDCAAPGGPWELLPAQLDFYTELPNWDGGLAYLEVHTSGTAAFDLIADGPANKLSHPSADAGDPVDVASGDFTHQHTDLFVPGRGVPLEFTRYYASGAGSNGVLGANWSHTYDMSLDIDPDYVAVKYPQGYRERFQDVGGGAYTSPDGTFDTLVESGGDYILTTKAQVAYTFDSSGILQTIEDRNGNTTTLAYDGNGHLDTVTDSSGRVLTFSYDAVVGGGAARNVPLKPFTNADFESGNYTTNWTKTGTAFGSSPGTEAVLGSRYGNSGAGGNSATGTLLSASFTAGHVLSMRIGGHVDASNLYVALVESGIEVLPTWATNGTDNMTTLSIDTSAYAGDSVQIKAVDTSTTGHLNVDDFMVMYGDHLRQIDVPLSRSVQFDYDADGNLTEVTDVKGGVTEYEYSANRMTKLIDANLHDAVRNLYDGGGRVWKQFDALGNITCFYYGWGPSRTDVDCPGITPAPTDARTVVVDPRGNATTYASDDLLRTVEVEDALGNTIEIDYDAANNVVCLTDQLGNKTGMTYDTKGNVTHVIDALNTDTNCDLAMSGVQWTMSYTGDNDIDLLTDPLGRQVDFVYDGSGNLTAVKRLDDMANVVLWTCFTPDSNGDVLEVVESTTLSNCTGNTTTFTYDANGNVDTITDPRFAGQLTPPQAVLDWDAGGRLETITNELGHTTTFTYDDAGAILTVEDEDAHTTTYTYDAKGKVESIEDPNLKLTGYEYDDADRLKKVIDALLQETVYDYDENGNLVSVVNARLKETTYAYDELNRLELVTDPLSNETEYTYDPAGNLETRTDARNLVTEYTFDALHRLEEIDHIGDDTITFTYDEVGNRETMVDGTGTTAYTYTALNLPETVEFPGARVVTYTYDETGRREQIEYPDTKTVDYTYDEAGRMETVTDWLTNVTGYTYDNAGMLDTVELPNGVITDYGYDTSDRLTSVVTTGPGPTTLSDLTYNLDDAGIREQIVDAVASGNYDFDYDDLYRLTDVTYPDTTTESFDYDEVGNRTLHGATAYGYDDADQLQSVGGTNYDYDANGNMTVRGSDTFDYDYENRMVAAGIGLTNITAAYDGDGLRQSLTVNAATTDYTWDVARRLPQVIDDESFDYVYGLDLISSTDGSGDQVYYSQDALGSTVAITDDLGGPLGAYSYKAFGEVRTHTGGVADPWLFTGEQRDVDGGMYYLRARYYDPAVGRFATRDPWPGMAQVPLSQQRYAYALNQPTGLRDPSGMCVFGAPCPEPFQQAADSLTAAANDVWNGAQQFADASRDSAEELASLAANAWAWGWDTGCFGAGGAAFGALLRFKIDPQKILTWKDALKLTGGLGLGGTSVASSVRGSPNSTSDKEGNVMTNRDVDWIGAVLSGASLGTQALAYSQIPQVKAIAAGAAFINATYLSIKCFVNAE